MTRPEDSPQAEDTAGAQASEQPEDPDADPAMMDTATKRNEAAAEGAG